MNNTQNAVIARLEKRLKFGERKAKRLKRAIARRQVGSKNYAETGVSLEKLAIRMEGQAITLCALKRLDRDSI